MHRAVFVTLMALALSARAGDVPAAGGSRAPPPASDRLADFFGRTKGITRLIPASDLWASIHSKSNPYAVVDVRPAEEYAKGHVPGAINLPIDVLFRPESLARLPSRDKPVVLVCQSGHTESMALGGLVALGYEPWVLRFGMIGWNAETKVKAGSPLQDGDVVRGVGGPIER
jgi:rhodanese-related sulfurtransferase